ncbi:MAG: Ig-like domain-containing protein, partial [Bacteroidia bacterium]|nr:Ig-like domain-containing protein [Bacteroidia bacterium]
MNHIIKFKYHIWILVFIAMGCAQFQSPKGGPRDTDPPLLIEAESEPNYQTNFVKKPIELHFNEWIKITNPTKEIVISPPTDYPIKVIEKGRRVLLEFSEDEVLKENTTYQINYGDAIKDFTEGNIIKNLVFIFSTGDVIDSLSVSGKMVDALTKEPLDNVIISLYDNLSDTAFTKTKPLYFTKTNKDGSFNLTNLRSDTFQIFGLTDNNVNYFYDRLDEKIAFNDSTIFVSDLDSTFVTLELFDEEDPPRQISVKQSKSGLIKLVYSPPLQDMDITLLDEDTFYTFHELVKDTVYIWHNALELDSLTFILKSGELSDTIMSKPAKDSFIGSNLNLDKSFVQKFNFHKEDSLNIRFNHPIKNIKLDSISVYDTVSSFNISYSEINNRILSIKLDSLQDNSSYSFQLLPGAITDIYNNSNT